MRNHNNVFSFIIDFTNKNKKNHMEAMKMINVTEVDGYNHPFKEHL
jgi:hypothetical protein